MEILTLGAACPTSEASTASMFGLLEHLPLLAVWITLFFLSYGILGINFMLMRRAARKPWKLSFDSKYSPKVTIIVPTYNESKTITYKLRNLSILDYPRNLTQIIVVDSNSEDDTKDLVRNFMSQHLDLDVQLLIDKETKGKSAALNLALKHCRGEIILISDADCFWPSEILRRSLPFLADPTVGAISGQKILLNSGQSWVTRSEDSYLNSIKLVKLGESKIASTLLFEGGFSAYKKEVLESFDPWNTGSDDCGTIVALSERNYRALFVPEACFYTVFPVTWRGKISVKVRRTNQLVRVLWVYLRLLANRRIHGSRRVILQNIMAYVFGPFIFLLLIGISINLLWYFPWLVFIPVVFLAFRTRYYLLETIQNYLLLLFSFFSLAFGKKFVVWKQPEDRSLLTEELLNQYKLI